MPVTPDSITIALLRFSVLLSVRPLSAGAASCGHRPGSAQGSTPGSQRRVLDLVVGCAGSITHSFVGNVVVISKARHRGDIRVPASAHRCHHHRTGLRAICIVTRRGYGRTFALPPAARLIRSGASLLRLGFRSLMNENSDGSESFEPEINRAEPCREIASPDASNEC